MSPANKLVATSKTWSVLQSTHNPAATVVLGAGLTHPMSAVRHSCLKALIGRNSEAANMLILTHWGVYDSNDRQLLRKHSAQFSASVRVLLSRGSVQIRELMLSAVSDLDLIDCADVLIELAINKKHALSPEASNCLLSLCKTWGNANRFGESRGEAHRPALVKMLHSELMRFPKSETLMEAWLSVAHWEDGPQRSLIADSSQTVYSQLLKAFSETTDPTALQLLAGYFWRSTTPPSITSIICEQPCPTLAIEMAKLVTNDQLESVLVRLRSLKPLACMSNLNLDELSLDRTVYRRLLLMMVASKVDVSWSLSRCTSLAKGSSAEMRRLATEVLQHTRVASTEKLIAIMQEDSTNNGGQKAIRDIHEIMGWLKHPSVALRQAATEFFREFTVESLVRQIGVWPARMCRVMAEVVAKVDTNMLQTLDEFLTSPAPKKRIAALQAVELMGCAPQLRERVLGLLTDPRIDVRVQVVDTLSASNDESLLPLIPKLLLDANTDVVEAANRASKRIERLEAAKAK